ncbi:hypothetical protein FRC12_009541 [Ceratobasidium sp. 428]|nr:hypothetical protein FRC12_009541 [Ceratobasidium sp. 428]
MSNNKYFPSPHAPIQRRRDSILSHPVKYPIVLDDHLQHTAPVITLSNLNNMHLVVNKSVLQPLSHAHTSKMDRLEIFPPAEQSKNLLRSIVSVYPTGNRT